ncbi:ABC transporter permease [Streptacidiphilus pinicola]|uniref:ABC transporter permease n=1 Tax=Streptacidiphilus pinicola TaxID=2219663 RepID=UPI001A9E5AE9|nr:ABC transporter permease [Streptacidiphilus pinicola]
MNARLRPYLLVVVLPLVAAFLLWAFAWPAARIAPRSLPLGVVGSDPAVVRVEQQLAAHAGPDGFAIHRYTDADAARTAIEHRDVYGALVLPPAGPELLTASAASPVVATMLTQLAAGTLGTTVTDVVPLPAGDPHGSAFVAGVLPTVIAGLGAGALTFLLGRGRGQRLLLLLLSSAAIGGAAVAVSQGWLGVLTGRAVANVGVVSLTVLAVSSAVCGFAVLLGHKGIGIGSLVLMLLGNAWSGAASAPELLPGAAYWVGRLLPAGAGATALRDSAYFGGHALGFPLTVLGAWAVFGLGLVALAGHRAPKRSPKLVATGGATALSAPTGARPEPEAALTATGPAGEITHTLPIGATAVTITITSANAGATV